MSMKTTQYDMDEFREDIKTIDSSDHITPTEEHPLLNPDSSHYQMVGGVEAITLMEEMFAKEELMAWAKLTAMKYRLRIGKKDDPGKEVNKIKTFEAYYTYLANKQ